MARLTRWSDEALRLADREAHAAVQDLREEVGEGVRDGCQTTEAQGETPDLKIKAGFEELDEVERLGGDIGSVSVDASNDEIHLTLVQETPGLLGAGVGEGHQEAVAHDSDTDG